MGITDTALERLFQTLISGNAGMAIAEARTYLAAWPDPRTQERLNAISSDYELMARYWQQGAADPLREEQYQRLLQRLYVLAANIAIHRHISGSSFLKGLYDNVRRPGMRWSLDDIRQEMENFVSETAMLELTPDHLRQEKSLTLYQQHHQRMHQLFDYVLTSHIWNDAVGDAMEAILLSPTIDTIDQQLLLAAVTLSLMNRFDIVKFRLMQRVYRQSTDPYVRQRAMVGWVLSIDDDWLVVYPELKETTAELLQSSHVCRDLTELQIQLIYTLNAEKDTNTLQKEIMPDLMKNNAFRITKHGIEEVEDDPMEDILNPGASEERMEKVEASFRRIVDMQRQGADVFFGGFAQMKRFPFFYDTCNWLVPFYWQHPDISRFVEHQRDNKFLELMMGSVHLCNSDKYSFLIAFQQVANRLPEHLRKLMSSGELRHPALDGDDEGRIPSPAMIRRSYLMDLYRFYRLFPNRSALCNPFDTTKNPLGMCLFFTSGLFSGTPLETYKREIVAVLRKQRQTEAAGLLLRTFPEHMHDVQYYLWTKNYSGALRLQPDSEKALSGMAREYFRLGMYDDAAETYSHLILLAPDNIAYMLGKAVCLVKMDEYDEAQQLLYQLNYEHPDDANTLRALAWTLTCNDKPEQADRFYQQLADQQQTVAEDYMNRACCQWLLGNIAIAADNFRQYLKAEGYTTTVFRDAFNAEWLRTRGITDIDIKMMQALVLGNDVLENDALPF